MRRLQTCRAFPFSLLFLSLTSFADPRGPIKIAEFTYKPIIVQERSGDLLAFTLGSASESQAITVQVSKDAGKTWSAQTPVLLLKKSEGTWGGPEALVDHHGDFHLFLVNDPSEGIDETGQKRKIPRGRYGTSRYDLWHTRSKGGLDEWEEPKRIWEGYTGALNSVLQMSTGRILLPFSYLTERSWANRGEGLDAFTFRGFFDSILVYSDDDGDSWRLSTPRLKVPVPDIVSAYGAVEPVAVELPDGRVWMLIRTQLGRFYESFSTDGANWSDPRPTAILSSDSPAGLARLPDDRIVLLWNKSLRFPYAYGGRHVIHAAVSLDGGKTWRGHREVAYDPLRHEPPPPRGDHGTAYPFPTALQDGRVIFTTGQGAGRVTAAVIDPDWLLETRATADFENGFEEWLRFGAKGVELVPHPNQGGSKVLAIRKIEREWPAAAVWNFPMGPKGRLSIRLRAEPGFEGLLVGLTDHFSVPFDLEDVFYNLFQATLAPPGGRASDIPFTPGQWRELEFGWDCEKRECRVSVDGAEPRILPMKRETPDGVCYLRLRSLAEDSEDAGVLIESVEADVSESFQ